MIELPINGSSNNPAPGGIYDLAGRKYTIKFHWNRRAGFWIMDLATASGPVASGIAVHVSRPLAHVEGGVIVAIDTSRKYIDPSIEELGGRVRIFFLERADLP